LGNLERGLLYTGNSESYEHMSRKTLEMEHLSPYSGSVTGTWRMGYCTEDSERHVFEGSGMGEFLS
jgi:hypothetical protein